MDDPRRAAALMAPSGTSDLEWSRAFGSQSLSDLDMQQLLARARSAKCHRLHFVQMAAEKLCKAFLIRANGYDSLKLTHSVIAKNLPLLVRRLLVNEGHSSSVLGARIKAVKLLGREIEVLSPSCDAAGTREDNSEYPWLVAPGKVQIPHEYTFPNINDGSAEFIALTKLMCAGAETYLV